MQKSCKLIFFQATALLACVINNANAQQLDWTALRQQVVQHHPLARRADTELAYADAKLLKAKGGFDPKSYADYEQKIFNGKDYFETTEAGLKWPSWMGLELKGAYLQARGNYLNPEHQLPENGQAIFGFNWSLGQGLLIDERRADLSQARIGLAQARAMRASEVNDLLMLAAESYWNWVLADNQQRLYENALAQAEIRLEALRESFRLGYKPALDTVEAFIQVQNRQLDVNFGLIERRNAALALSNFYWQADARAIQPEQLGNSPQLEGGLYAAVLPGDSAQMLASARTQHPQLAFYQGKLEQLGVERRLKQEMRKPVLDLNYNLLGNGWSFTALPDNGNNLAVLANNIKWGVNFSYPIRNRKARGDWQLTQIKLAQTDFELSQKRQEIDTKVRHYLNELNNLSRQIRLYKAIVANRKTLLDGELERFRLGSGSVFLINTREQSLLDAQVKYYKLLATYHKTEASVKWAMGGL